MDLKDLMLKGKGLPFLTAIAHMTPAEAMAEALNIYRSLDNENDRLRFVNRLEAWKKGP